MRFGVLGPVEAWNGSKSVNLGAPLQRGALAILLLEANKLVPVARLVELLWGEQPPATATKNVQIYVHRLRKAFNGVPDVNIRTRAPGYVLEVDPDQVDVHLFRGLVTQARHVDDGTASVRLAEALRLWRGPALADVGADPLASVSAQLAEERLAALEARIQADLRLGRHAQILSELTGLVRTYPLREHLRELLMIALFRCDRRADALAVYREGHELLVSELGVAPGATLAQVHQQILRGEHTFAALAPHRPATPATPQVSPYQGLSAFSPDHARYFFGRETLTAQLVERLADGQGPVLVVGASGAGKSSLLRAGLVPRLSGMNLAVGGRWHCVLLTPDADPLQQLGRHLAPVLGLPPGALPDLADPARLAEAVRSARGKPGAPGRVVLIVDQFEELFTLCQDDRQRAMFVAALAAVCGPAADGWMRVVLGIRADFYGHAAAFGELTSALERPFLVGAMTGPQLRDVIEGPARVAGLTVDDGLTELLLADLGGQVPGSLPLLSYALLATWQHREGNRLTLSGYHATGGIRGAIAKTADDTYQRFDPDSQQVLRRLLLRMVRVDPDNQHTRRRVPLTELTAVAGDDPAITRYVLDQLTQARLVTVDRQAAEITHEALIRAWPLLGSWIDADRASLLIRQQLSVDAAAWERRGQDPAFLYADTRLADARALQREHSAPLGALEQRFLAASEHRGRRADRRRRVVIAALAIISVLALGASAIAIVQRQDAERKSNDATSRAAAVQMITLLNTDPSLAAQVSLASYRIAPTVEARSALVSSSALPWGTRLTDHRGPVRAVATAPNRPLAASGGADGTVRLWDLTTRRELATRRADGSALNAVTFADAGRTVLAAGSDGTVHRWDITDPAKPAQLRTLRAPGGELRGVGLASGLLLAASGTGSIIVWEMSAPDRPDVVPEAHHGGVTALAVSPDGGTVATGGRDGAVRLWTVDGSRLVPAVTLTGHSEEVTSLAFSPDGTTVASGSLDHTVRRWTAAGPVGEPLAHNSGVLAVAFGPGGRTLVSGSDDHVVNQFDLTTGTMRMTFPQPETVRAVGVSADGEQLLTGSDNGTVRVWSLTGPVLPASTRVTSTAFSPDGRILATTGAPGGGLQLWDSADPRRLRELGAPPTQSTGPVTAIAFSPSGKIMATGTADATIQLWDLDDPGHIRPLRTLPAGHRDSVTALTFSSDSGLLASGSSDAVVLWNVYNPEAARIAGRLDASAPISFHPNRNVLAVTSGRRLQLWNVDEPATPSRIAQTDTGHDGELTDVAFDGRGQTLATASEDKTVRLWHAAGLSAFGVPLTGHSGIVQAVRFGPTNTLLSAGQDGSLFVWNLDNPGNPDLPTAMFTNTPQTGLTALSLARDGHTVAVGTATATITGDIDPAHIADLICATDSRPLSPTEWARYFPDTPQQPSCP